MQAEGKDIKDIFHGLKYLMDKILTSWTIYTPTISSTGGAFTGTAPTKALRYKKIGKTVFVAGNIVLVDITGASGYVILPLPVSANNANFLGSCYEYAIYGSLFFAAAYGTDNVFLSTYGAAGSVILNASYKISFMYESI